MDLCSHANQVTEIIPFSFFQEVRPASFNSTNLSLLNVLGRVVIKIRYADSFSLSAWNLLSACHYLNLIHLPPLSLVLGIFSITLSLSCLLWVFIFLSIHLGLLGSPYGSSCELLITLGQMLVFEGEDFCVRAPSLSCPACRITLGCYIGPTGLRRVGFRVVRGFRGRIMA